MMGEGGSKGFFNGLLVKAVGDVCLEDLEEDIKMAGSQIKGILVEAIVTVIIIVVIVFELGNFFIGVVMGVIDGWVGVLIWE